MGRIVFGFKKNGRLPLPIIITVEVVMVVVLIICSTLLWHNK